MATHEEKIAIVQEGVDQYAIAEPAIENAINALNALVGVYDDAFEAEMFDKQGAYLKIKSGHRVLAGKLAEVYAELIALHEKGTKLAKDNDADVALPSGYSGVTILGGGR